MAIRKEGTLTDLDEPCTCGGHEEPGSKVRGGPVQVHRRTWWNVYRNVVEHVWPGTALRIQRSEHYMRRHCCVDQQREYGGQLKHKVDGCQWPVVLGGEEELNEQHRRECQHNPVEDDLDGQRARERGPQLEDRIMREATASRLAT